jgi:lauroyl/myristoyl acyltransferase
LWIDIFTGILMINTDNIEPFQVMASWKILIKLKLHRFLGLLRNIPPGLPAKYTQKDFYWFMRREIFHYSPSYVMKQVIIHNSQRVMEVARTEGAVMAFLHYGSFFLSGGAIVHQLGLTYTAVISRRFLTPEITPPRDIPYWKLVHKIASSLYCNHVIYNDESPLKAINWLKQKKLLGVALDVREIGQRYKEARFRFLDKDIYMQYNPARMANIIGAPLIPMTIQYDTKDRRHHLFFGHPVRVQNDPISATQELFHYLEQGPRERPEQLYHDIVASFREPSISLGNLAMLN